MQLSKTLMSCGMASVLTVGISLLASEQAEAQPIPACRSIQPSPGQVCYTEHPYSARQKDEGGTKDWSFIVERWAPNYIIVDYEVLRPDSRFGSASLPTGSIVSGTGNASIIQESTRQIETLGETKSQLKGKVQGCYPPVCGQLQGQIERIDREIERLSSTQRTAIEAGGNEKITFTHKTSVSCRKYLGVRTCKEGASIEGKVRVNQRYLGDPNSLRQASLSLVEQSRALLQQASTPVPNPAAEPVRPPSQTKFAAIARSEQTRKFGMSWAFTTREAAESRAIQECIASDCQVITWANNAFLAIAEADDGAWGATWGNTDGEAKQKALELCRQSAANPNTCRITFITHTNGQGVGLVPLKGVFLAGRQLR